MTKQHNVRTYQMTAAALWGVLGAVVALSALADVNPDVRILVGVLSVVLPGASIAAALAIRRNQPASAMVLLMISALTPTYFAWALNLIPLVIVASIAFEKYRSRRLTG